MGDPRISCEASIRVDGKGLILVKQRMGYRPGDGCSIQIGLNTLVLDADALADLIEQLLRMTLPLGFDTGARQPTSKAAEAVTVEPDDSHEVVRFPQRGSNFVTRGTFDGPGSAA